MSQGDQLGKELVLIQSFLSPRPVPFTKATEEKIVLAKFSFPIKEAHQASSNEPLHSLDDGLLPSRGTAFWDWTAEGCFLLLYKGASGVMVIAAGIGHGDTSSNPGLIAFHIALIPLGKVWIQLFSLQLWVNSRVD